MKALSVFHPYITTDVMGCPYPTVDQRIVLACREFCAMTSAWREWLDVLTLDGTTDTFDHDLDNSQELMRYTRAIINDDADRDFNIVSRKDLPGDWATNASTGLVDTVVHLDGSQFQLFPMPTAGDTLRMEAVFMPTIGASQVGDVLFDRYADAIASGALARLLMLPNQPWTNPALATQHNDRFQLAAHAAANDGFRQRSRKRTRKAPL